MSTYTTLKKLFPDAQLIEYLANTPFTDLIFQFKDELNVSAIVSIPPFVCDEIAAQVMVEMREAYPSHKPYPSNPNRAAKFDSVWLPETMFPGEFDMRHPLTQETELAKTLPFVVLYRKRSNTDRSYYFYIDIEKGTRTSVTKLLVDNICTEFPVWPIHVIGE
tara:strand:+ start:5508 stop:5996 length:489 start_codon:yes stop_codon:yes gene_type:complete